MCEKGEVHKCPTDDIYEVAEIKASYERQDIRTIKFINATLRTS
jgi:hypothetical protein